MQFIYSLIINVNLFIALIIIYLCLCEYFISFHVILFERYFPYIILKRYFGHCLRDLTAYIKENKNPSI